MKFKKLFSLSALCLVGVLGVGLVASCDTEDEDTTEDCTGETCSTGDEEGETSPTERTYTSQSLFTFNGTINLGLGTTVGGVIGSGTYYGDVDIPTTLTIGVYDDDHYTIWLDCEIPIQSVSLSIVTVKLTGYGGDVLDSVDTSHLSLYYDSEEGNVYYHRIDTGSGTNINTYEVYGEFEKAEFLKNPLYYATKDMFGCGQRIFDGIGDIVISNPLDFSSLQTALTNAVTSSEITSGNNIIGDTYSLTYDAGAPDDTTSAVGEISASVSIYDDHSKDAIYMHVPTYFTVNLGVLGSYDIGFDITMDLALDSTAPKEVTSDSFSEIEGYISENASHFTLNTAVEESYLASTEGGESASLADRTYTDVTTYSGNISLTLSNTAVGSEEYTGTATVPTTLEVGTYTDGNGDSQTSYLLSCEIPETNVEFSSGNYIKLTGYANNSVIEANKSELTVLYDTGDDIIAWHRLDESEVDEGETPDTYEDWGIFEHEVFSEKPIYYVTHDLFGCGARLYNEAANAVTETMLNEFIGDGIIGSDGSVSAELNVPFTYTVFIITYNLEFDLAVNLTKDTTSSDSDGSTINAFITYVNSNPTRYVMNSVIEDSYIVPTIGNDDE